MSKERKDWLSSKEAMKKGRLQSCDLMHLRTAGKLSYEKRGNAFFYDPKDIDKAKS